MLRNLAAHSALMAALGPLQRCVAGDSVFETPDIRRFVFLCGATQASGSISARRQAIMAFAQRHLPHAQFFIAETLFKVLMDEGHSENLLDIEKELSDFADNIVIVLESPSAICELGAFAHDRSLRGKLLVINDVRFVSTRSFINIGPLKAIEELSPPNRVLHYKMAPESLDRVDAIGDVFASLHSLLKEPLRGRAVRLERRSYNPAIAFSKTSIRFVHDLLVFFGVATRPELIQALEIIFGKNDYKKLSQHLGLLTALGVVTRTKTGLFTSKSVTPYLKYKDLDVHDVMSVFRNRLLRDFPERLHEAR